MAKGKKEKGKKKPTPPKLEKPDYGMDYLTKELGLETATIRQRLRSLDIKKAGRQYDFKSKAEADKVVKRLKAIGEKKKD